jgi:hypothetical protein
MSHLAPVAQVAQTTYLVAVDRSELVTSGPRQRESLWLLRIAPKARSVRLHPSPYVTLHRLPLQTECLHTPRGEC